MEEDFFSHRQSNLVFLFLVAVNIFLLTAHLSGFVRGFKNFFFYILAPAPQSAARVMQVEQGVVGNLQEIVNVHQENVALRKLVEQYALMQNEYERAREENLRLRSLVNFPVPPKNRSIVARVITREPSSWFQWVIIDKGKADGILADAPVLTWVDNAPAVLGRVGEVSQHSAKVVLITNVLSALPSMVKASGEDGLLEGQNGLKLKLNYLLPEGKVAIGDEITTSALSSVFPSGILIGKVQDINTKENEQFHSAIVKAAVNFNTLREVVVLMPAGEKENTEHR